MSRETFGRFMLEVGATPKRLTKTATGEHLTDVTDDFGRTSRKAEVIIHQRPHGYCVGPLEAARRNFETATGLAPDWPSD